MGKESNIEWTDATWNVAQGCTKVDADCKYCYMYRNSYNKTRYNPMEVVKTKTVFKLPLRIKEPSKIFTSSLTDFFHEQVDPFREEAWDIIERCPQHTFQILTKRPERIKDCLPKNLNVFDPNAKNFLNNVWLGTSIGSESGVNRIDQLTPYWWCVPVLFLSLEPLHGPIALGDIPEFNMIDWVIVGGESGNDSGAYRYRPCQVEWIEQIVEECKIEGIPVFVKQLGTHLAKELKLKDRHGRNMEEWPAYLDHLKVRQFPEISISESTPDKGLTV
ncbi:DUF5131 family protein [Telluribacter humicola]|uniref:DUF5131 family protein n=1 Tax=Telluribacter humicola TaxID=1720261 RepID=UPI001A9622A3|nr:DUF5131 family protein [Telluribacter humicola]